MCLSKTSGSNKCAMVWEGTVARPSFQHFAVHRTEGDALQARQIFEDAKCAQYWDLARSVVVDIAARVAIFFDEHNKPFASFPITTGESRFIKFGEWKITKMVTTPEFRWDKAMLEEGKRSTEFYQLPIGPNSPVGVLWTSTTRNGIGLHGTSSPHTIGRSESHGCVERE